MGELHDRPIVAVDHEGTKRMVVVRMGMEAIAGVTS